MTAHVSEVALIGSEGFATETTANETHLIFWLTCGRGPDVGLGHQNTPPRQNPALHQCRSIHTVKSGRRLKRMEQDAVQRLQPAERKLKKKGMGGDLRLNQLSCLATQCPDRRPFRDTRAP